MALRAVTDHPKFARLKRLLKLSKGPALGYLEALWHFTGRYTPQGDLGKYSNEEIEAWIEWDGDPGALIEAYVTAGWVDVNAAHRLVVHDWHQHADDATKLALKRSGRKFVTAMLEHVATKSKPVATVSGLPEPVPVPVPEPEPVPLPPAAKSVVAISGAVEDFSLELRILCESVGCFGMREQRDLHEAMQAHMKLSGMNAAAAREHMSARWNLLGEHSERLQWVWGSSHKFFISGKWNLPDTWPWKPGESPPSAASKKRKDTDYERTQSVLKGIDDARKEWEKCREEDAARGA